MIRLLSLSVAALLLSACSVLAPKWHWEKPGGNYEQDERFCKAQTYSGTDGMVTHASVRRMHACMEGKGWRKIEN